MKIPKTPLPFMWQFMQQYKFFNITVILLSLARGAQYPVTSWFTKQLVDGLPNAKENVSILIFPAVGIVMSYWVLGNLCARLSGVLGWKYEEKIKNNITSSLFNYVLGASQEFFHRNSVGLVCAQIANMAKDFIEVNLQITISLVAAVGQIFLSLFLLYRANIYFFYTLFIYLVIYISFTTLMYRKALPFQIKYAESLAQTTSAIDTAIVNYTNVKIYNNRKYEALQIEPFLNKNNTSYRAKLALMLWIYFTEDTITSIVSAIILLFLVKFYIQGSLTVGDFGLILVILTGLQGNLRWLCGQISSIYQVFGRMKNGLSILVVPRSMRDLKDAADLVISAGEIRFNSVSFSHNEDKIFENLSLTIAPKSKVALVGYSGSGKTTLANLILRFYDISDGKITIDDQNIREVKQKSLRDKIGLIPQDPMLFNRSIMENIRYGKVSASDEEVVEASKKAYAHDFIMQLPENYNTMIGKSQLSGGQRQKIAIARAILKNAPILILDEPTSQLDYLSEKHIQASLKEFMKDKTVITIAHRLSTIISMDRILVIDEGKIAQDGDHTTLLNQKGIYNDLVMSTL